jgi:hypothetical protein
LGGWQVAWRLGLMRIRTARTPDATQECAPVQIDAVAVELTHRARPLTDLTFRVTDIVGGLPNPSEREAANP